MCDPRKFKRIADLEKAEFDAATQKLLEDIDECQNEIDESHEKANMEIAVIERKYHQQRKPCYEKRDRLISQIPHFWVTAIMNHPDLSSLFDDAAENVLQHLIRLEVQEYDDILSGYSIKFYFEGNNYFENTVLTKDYLLNYDTPRCEYAPIIWKEGYNLSQSQDTPRTSKKRRHDSDKNFFNWYADTVDPLTDDIAEIIKDDLWMNPLQYYLVPDVDADGNDSNVEAGSSSSENEEAKDDIKSENNR